MSWVDVPQIEFLGYMEFNLRWVRSLQTKFHRDWSIIIFLLEAGQNFLLTMSPPVQIVSTLIFSCEIFSGVSFAIDLDFPNEIWDMFIIFELFISCVTVWTLYLGVLLVIGGAIISVDFLFRTNGNCKRIIIVGVKDKDSNTYTFHCE